MSLADIPVSGFPSLEDQSLARISTETIAKFGETLPEFFLVGDGLECPIPKGATRQVLRLIAMIAEGQPVELIPALPELTVRQSANFLGFTEGHVNELLAENILEYRLEGDQRLISRESLLEFEHEYKSSRAAMAELTRLSQEIGLYDD